MKKIKHILILLIIISVFSLAVYLCAEYYSSKYSNDIFRLHVLANSNSAQDQALKLKVRDSISDYLYELSESSNNVEDVKAAIKKNSNELELIAEKCVRDEGYDYEVNVEIGEFYFPTKKSMTERLPAGNYDAVRVIIGEGNGDNWWCVLFPPLSFSKGIVSENSAKQIEASKEFRDDYEVKFKFVEIYQEAKHKLLDFFARF